MIILLLCLILFLLIGPQVPISQIQTPSLRIREQITTFVQDQIIDPIREQGSEIQIRNPLQTAADRRADEYNQAVEAVTGAAPAEPETCIALFGSIPLNCPDPAGEGILMADQPRDTSSEECIAVFGLTPLECEVVAR